jgi:hypothetical protein
MSIAIGTMKDGLNERLHESNSQVVQQLSSLLSSCLSTCEVALFRKEMKVAGHKQITVQGTSHRHQVMPLTCRG